jgi:hypothetical protein
MMAANKRTKAQRELDLEKLSELVLEGKSQGEMAQRLGVSQSQVSQDLKKLDERWQKALHNADMHKARELARLYRLERKYNEAWERSLADKEIKTAERTTVGQSDRTKVVSRHEQRDGNSAFLDGIERCIQLRCRILGIVAKESPEFHVTTNVTTNVLGLSVEEFKLLPTEEKARLLRG